MSQTLKEIQRILKGKSSPEAKAAHQKFIPGEQKVYGVRTPVLNELAATYKIHGFELSEELWNAGVFEEKLLAVKILERIAKKDPEQTLKLIQLFAKDIGNWAICDAMGMQALNQLRKTHAVQIFALAKKYNHSKDFWQRRLSLVMVEWYTRMPEHHSGIKALMKELENDNEYYVKKAIVWIKKNFAKGK
jgi:3-methyladenine DNA glycosylase AlkD